MTDSLRHRQNLVNIPRSTRQRTSCPSDDDQHASVVAASIQIERCMDRFGQRILLTDKQDADLPAEHVGGDGHDVVAADDAIGFETVRRADRELGGQASNGGRDRRHRHPSEVGSYELPG